MRETVKFTVEELGEFEIYKTRTCRDDIQIETEAGSLCGGGVELIKFKIGVSNQYERVQSQAKKDVNNNLMDLAFFMDLNETLQQAYSYAILKVLIVKSPKPMLDWSTEELKKVYSAYEVALAPFSGVKQPTTNEVLDKGVQQP